MAASPSCRGLRRYAPFCLLSLLLSVASAGMAAPAYTGQLSLLPPSLRAGASSSKARHKVEKGKRVTSTLTCIPTQTSGQSVVNHGVRGASGRNVWGLLASRLDLRALNLFFLYTSRSGRAHSGNHQAGRLWTVPKRCPA